LKEIKPGLCQIIIKNKEKYIGKHESSSTSQTSATSARFGVASQNAVFLYFFLNFRIEHGTTKNPTTRTLSSYGEGCFFAMQPIPRPPTGGQRKIQLLLLADP
jgi:hypothetical protein